MEPIDTMNLAAMSLRPVKKEESPQQKEGSPVDTADLRLMLFPSQVHKLSCLLALMAHMRDLVERLLVMDSSHILSSLDWRSQLQYMFNKENKGVTIKVGEHICHAPIPGNVMFSSEIDTTFKTIKLFKQYLICVIKLLG